MKAIILKQLLAGKQTWADSTIIDVMHYLHLVFFWVNLLFILASILERGVLSVM